MNDQFVTYEIAKKLKELGFSEECFRYYDGKDTELALYMQSDYSLEGENFNSSYWTNYGFCSAPLWQQAIDWLREKHKLEVVCVKMIEEEKYCATIHWSGVEEFAGQIDMNTYFEAREAAILKALELISK